MSAPKYAPKFQGSITALVTPMKNGAVDLGAFQDFVAWQIAEGSHGLVPVGTTGESPTLTHSEHDAVVASCIEVAAGKVPVIAGCGSNSTAEAVRLAKSAEAAGADAALVVTPYYNKPNQEGLYQHYKAIHEACGLPIIIYNIPGRSIIDMSLDTFQRLNELERIVGVKDATGDVMRVQAYRVALGDEFIQLTGEDNSVYPYMAQGGHGCISVTANVAPKQAASVHDLIAKGDWLAARDVTDSLMGLHTDLFAEPNPCPAKYALSKLGKMANEVRLPLVPISKETKTKIDAAMAQAGL